MKFTINRETFLTPLQQIVSVIEKRQTMPILGNVLLVLENDYLTMTGTDLEVQLISKLHLPNAVSGSITVPARKFLDICRLLPVGSEIRFEQNDDKVKITSNRSRFSLNCLPADNYPEFDEGELDHFFLIKAGQFKKALEKTTFCMANQDVRYYLNGMLLHISNSRLELVASDGHRLALYEDQLEVPTGFEARIILPRKGVLELNKLIGDNDVELSVEFSSSSIRIYIGDMIFSAKLVDSKYPDFSKVFQQSFFKPIQIDRASLKNSLTRVAVLSNEKFKGISFEVSDELLKMSAHNPEHDEAEEELAVVYGDEALSIAFNAQYLSEAVSSLDGDIALITVANDSSSCFINEPNNEKYKYVVMAMRL